MTRPWIAERIVADDTARSLIETQFPALAPVRIESLGTGWDNTAYRVNDEWVFRFPRREIAVGLLQVEMSLLPMVASKLPLPVPVPTMLGRPEDRFPWPFAGYRLLPGRTACAANLDDAARIAAAAPIASFLAALHAVNRDQAAQAGAPPDTLRRLDVTHRAQQIAERIEQCRGAGILDDVQPWLAVVDEVPSGWSPGSSTLVHGDLYARHLLVDDDSQPCGVIDWGDAHLGDPAIDLAIAHGFLPPSAHAVFRDVYGPVDDDTWRMARFKALHSALMILVYGHDTGDEDLLSEGRTALRHLADEGLH